MPPQLNDEVAKVSQAFGTLKQRLDRGSVEALGKQVLALRQLLKDILSSLDVLDKDELSEARLKAWDKLSSDAKLKLLKKVDEKVVIEESTELKTFFRNVSNSVIEAQKQLNELSRTYIDDLEKEKSPVPPTFFAIPSLKAEMKLGVSEVTSEGINVILFKSEQQKERFFESAVTFELVSTPPAPATRPKPETELQPAGPPVALAAPSAEESTRIDELTLELEEAKAAMMAVTESLTEAKPSEIRKPKRAPAKKLASKTKKATTKKSRSTKKGR